MKYRIDIWHSGNIIASHESDDLKELADWYKENWFDDYERGLCALDIYEQRKDIPFEEALELGFY